METGDGLLARVHPAGGVLDAEQARTLAEAAEACGNGLLEVTGRGNLQLRGITETSHPDLLARLDAHGLVEADGDGPHRLTINSPLAGLDPADLFDAAALARAVEEAAHEVGGLPPKTAVVVDGGGRFSLRGVEADFHLIAMEPSRVAVGLAAPAGPLWIGRADLAAAPEVVQVLLTRLAALQDGGQVYGLRVHHLPAAKRERLFADRPAGLLAPAPPQAGSAKPPHAGVIALGQDRAAVLAALPYGRITGAVLARVASLADHLGTGEIRLSFTRALLLPCPVNAAPELLRAVQLMGFIVDPHDPRLHVSACPGRPACAAGLSHAQADAGTLASAARALVQAGGSLHVSGCTKGCAHPGRASLTLIGQAGGGYGVVVGGTARDPARVHLGAGEIALRLAQLGSLDDLVAGFGTPDP